MFVNNKQITTKWKQVYSNEYLKVQETLSLDNVGKWMIFLPLNDYFYSLLNSIFKACKNNELGISVKYPLINTKKDSVIIVYTKDYTDIVDVSRVLTKLRELGVKGKLYYKTDKMTKEGISGSLFSSDEFETKKK